MGRIYYLKNNDNIISYKVQIGTTAIAATKAYTSRSGTGNSNITYSKANKNGVIPKTSLGASVDLIGAALITTSIIKPIGTQTLKEIAEKLYMGVTLYGGLDNEQTYEITSDDISIYDDSEQLIVSMAIKLRSI